jgi:hypothetical protein
MRMNDPVAYPDELRARESGLIAARRGVDAEIDPEEAVGFGLSGGGIRSATFCLGVFQSLAKFELLQRIDYLSTVSGGGYFGCFLGRLFMRGEPAEGQTVIETLSSAQTAEGPTNVKPAAAAAEPSVRNASDVEAILTGKKAHGVLRALRSNGRYLSPAGGGDLLLAAAVILRNWLAVQFILLVTLLAALAWIETARVAGFSAAGANYAQLEDRLNPHNAWLAGHIYWSALIAAGPALFGLFALPSGIAYWIPRSRWYIALAGAATTFVITALLGKWQQLDWAYFTAAVSVSLLLASVSLAGVGRIGPKKLRTSKALEVESDVRNRLSRSFSTGLWLSIVGLGIGVVDSIGRTIYALIQLGRLDDWRTWFASGITGMVGGGLGARTVSILFAARPSGTRLRLPTSMLATLAAALVCSFMLVSASVAVQALTWNFGMPARAHKIIVPEQTLVHWSSASISHQSELEFRERRRAQFPDSKAIAEDKTSAKDQGRHCISALAWAFGLSLLALVIGFSQRFLLFSSHHPLYSARLTRAYLGASNPHRMQGNNDLTEVLPDDDVSLCDYFPRSEEEPGSIARGAPLHFINVTINETVDGESKLQQQDRRGTGMAVGPSGLSVGVRHHATFFWSQVAPDVQEGEQKIVWTRPQANPGAEQAVFPDVPRFTPEELSLGRWMSLSGAAFSTGLGSRTSFALSLLAGVFNIRLGYWWNPRLRPASGQDRFFVAQHYLGRELFARFPGTARRRWYLTDGGHFENMGGYELIRRRLRKIVIIDAEADPDYTFDGLADLVRKARLDFGAEIVFSSREQLDQTVAPALREFIGTLADLRRLGDGASANEPERTSPSLAHAALATITYRDGTRGRLLYIKPTLLGRESADLVHYHARHADFPQETTADQFFDEAQWESYRKLGAHIGHLLFEAEPQQGKFVARDLLDWKTATARRLAAAE